MKKYEGSVLVAVLLFFYLFTQFFLLMVTDYRLTHSFAGSTKDFYTAKIMKTMFLSEIAEIHDLRENGQLTYSTGSLEYVKENMALEIIITVSGKRYIFHENMEK